MVLELQKNSILVSFNAKQNNSGQVLHCELVEPGQQKKMSAKRRDPAGLIFWWQVSWENSDVQHILDLIAE